MPRNSAVKKKQIEKEETLNMWEIKEQMKHPTPRQKAIGKVMDEMKTKGVSIPTPNKKNRIVKVRASDWLIIRVKQEQIKKDKDAAPLTYEEKIIADYFDKRVKELMGK